MWYSTWYGSELYVTTGHWGHRLSSEWDLDLKLEYAEESFLQGASLFTEKSDRG